MRVMSGVYQLLQDPIEAYHKAVTQWHERDDRDDTPCEYILDENWRQRLGVSSYDRERTDRLCRSIEATLTAKGIRPGPESYLFWNDGDPAFLQAIWRLIRQLNAVKVVETGVAHGVTTRIILEALNGRGNLWSIDLPPSWGWIPTRSATPSTALVPQRKVGFPIPNAGLLLGFQGTKTVRREGISSAFSDAGVALRPRTQGAPDVHREIGAAVGDRSLDQWSLIFGSSRRRLPTLLPRIKPIDLFIHDSHHSKYISTSIENLRSSAGRAQRRPGRVHFKQHVAGAAPRQQCGLFDQLERGKVLQRDRSVSFSNRVRRCKLWLKPNVTRS